MRMQGIVNYIRPSPNAHKGAIAADNSNILLHRVLSDTIIYDERFVNYPIVMDGGRGVRAQCAQPGHWYAMGLLWRSNARRAANKNDIFAGVYKRDGLENIYWSGIECSYTHSAC